MADQLSAYKFLDIYAQIGLDMSKLGCIMLDIDPSYLPPFKNMENLYNNSNGSLAAGDPHVTLLFGLLQSGWEYKPYIDELLQGWTCDSVIVDKVDFFDSPDPVGKPYYCIVAHVVVTPELQDAHDRLQILPHVDTFPGYKAHMTIAYINRDAKVRDDTIEYYQEALVGNSYKVTGLNYGYKPGGEDLGKSMYCVACRSKKEPNDVKQVNLKNGKPASKGTCPDCGTSMFLLGVHS